MITTPASVLDNHPIRKTRAQKKSFRADAFDYFKNLNYPVSVEKGVFGAHNVVVGNPDKAKYIISAHYDTPAKMIIPNLITPFHFLPFILWQIALVFILSILPLCVYFVANHFIHSAYYSFLAADVFFLVECAVMMFGPANEHNANDNTSGVVNVLDIAANLPDDLREKVCFVLFDLEEAGLWGSYSYAKKHSKAIKGQVNINLDCVGNGDHIYFVPGARFKKNADCMKWLNKANGISEENKTVNVRNKGFSYYPSDQTQFPYGIGVTALSKLNNGWLYCDKIHTCHDTVIDLNNIYVLRKAILGLVEENVF